MRVDSFQFLESNIAPMFEGDKDIGSIDKFKDLLKYWNYSLNPNPTSPNYVIDLRKSKKGVYTFYLLDKNQEVRAYLYDDEYAGFLIKNVSTYGNVDEFFSNIDNSIEQLLDPSLPYFKNKITVEEDGELLLEIEELVCNGVVVAERIINHNDSFKYDNEKEKALYMALSSFGFGGIEVVYSQNQNIIDLDLIGDLPLSKTNLDRNTIEELYKVMVFDILIKSANYIKRNIPEADYQK